MQHQKVKLAKLFHLSRLVSAILSSWSQVVASEQEKRKVKQELVQEVATQLQRKKTLRMWNTLKYAI